MAYVASVHYANGFIAYLNHSKEAKQLAQQAIPDPKTEGINGKYVLTVDIVGDHATYTWEKIDRTTGETPPTE